mmetsp:Transcript_51301/g.129493  ORF Transcript_51301/g.129493 Transcript_51301/m.129493 type:complete len:300 (+) Transcript_51301:709-1608(+)
MDILLDENAAGSAAALAHVDEQTNMARGDCLVDVGILADDHGALPAELECHLFQVCLASSLYDPMAYGGATCEGNLSDVGVPSDGVTGCGAIAVHDVHHTCRKSRLFDQVTHQQSGKRRLLTQFHDDGATHGQGWGELPRLHEKGEVPWNDGADHTNRLVPSEAERAAGVLRWPNNLASHLVRPTGVIPVTLHHKAQVNIVGHVFGLAVVQRLHLGQSCLVLLDEVCKLQQKIAARGAVGVLPRLEGFRGSSHSQVDILLPGFLNSYDLCLISGVNGIEGLAGLCVNPLVVDEELRAEC